MKSEFLLSLERSLLYICFCLSNRPHFSSPAWANQSKFPVQFADSVNQQDQSFVPSNFSNYDTGRNLNKQSHVKAPKRTRSPVQYDDLDGFTEDSVSVQTESKRYCMLSDS